MNYHFIITKENILNATCTIKKNKTIENIGDNKKQDEKQNFNKKR